MDSPISFIAEIERSIAQSTERRRSDMVRRLTDLFLVNADDYSEREIALIDDVFVRLVETIEEASRALLAIRIAPNAKAPLRILSALACDDAIDVASPVLIHAERLNDATLIKCATTKSQEHLLAISRRKSITEAVTDILVERGDQQVILSTAKNAGARFSDHGFTRLVGRAEGDDLLTACVGNRPDLPPHIFEHLLEVASDTVRAKLEAESPHARHDIHRAVDSVSARIKAQATAQSPQFAAAQALVETLKQTGKLDVHKVEDFAKARRLEEAVIALALLSDMPFEIIERKISDDHTDFLVILAKALGMSWQTTEAILALGAKAKPRSPDDLSQCLVAYQRLTRVTAQQILDFHRRREAAAKGSH